MELLSMFSCLSLVLPLSTGFSVTAPPHSVVCDPADASPSIEFETRTPKASNLNHNWWPVTLEESLDINQPNPIELLGKTLVLYHDGDGWNCLEDRCSHRFAPLSEGRVITSDGDSGTQKLLQCAYHGWEFKADGSLQRVPQNSNNILSTKTRMDNCGKIQTYPVRQGGDMIWVWPDASTQTRAGDTPLPVSHLLTEYTQDYQGSGFMRDLPYGYELLAENLLDVSHLPFSHHGTGGFDRDQARPLTLKMMSTRERTEVAEAEANNSPLFRPGDDKLPTPIFQAAVQNASLTDPTLVMFADAGRPVAENATSSSAFYAPSHIRYRRVIRSNLGANIELFLCPTGPGRSRVFLFTAIERVLKRSLKASVQEKKGFFGKLKQRFINSRISIVIAPSVAGHMVSHDIFDGDGIFLQKQGDRMQRYDLTEKDYYTPTTVDSLVLTFRRWLGAAATITAAGGDETAAKSATGIGAYNTNAVIPTRTRAEMLNRYETHTKNCPLCLASLAKQRRRKSLLQTTQTILLGSIGASCVAPLFIGSLSKRALGAAVIAAAGTLLIELRLKKLEKRIQNFFYVDYVHAKR